MNCEICGSEIYGVPKKIVVEGTRLLVCLQCSGIGELDLSVETKTSHTTSRTLGTPKSAKPTSSLPKEVEELEIADNFPSIIKRAREKNRMSQQELATAVKERLSIIQKIELGKMAPNLRLTHAFEHVLKVKLLLPRKETEVPAGKLGQSEITLGDVVQYKK